MTQSEFVVVSLLQAIVIYLIHYCRCYREYFREMKTFFDENDWFSSMRCAQDDTEIIESPFSYGSGEDFSRVQFMRKQQACDNLSRRLNHQHALTLCEPGRFK
jgi:hypothetical protein